MATKTLSTTCKHFLDGKMTAFLKFFFAIFYICFVVTRYAKGKDLLKEEQKEQERQLEMRTVAVDEDDSKQNEENCIMEALLELF